MSGGLLLRRRLEGLVCDVDGGRFRKIGWDSILKGRWWQVWFLRC